MNELTLIYVLIGLVTLLIVCVVILLMNNKGLNREVNSMVNAYQNLSRQVDEMKQNDIATIQAVQTSLKTFGDTISQNQRDSAENMDKRLFDLNNRFSNMAVENEQKLENIRKTMETKIKDLTEENNNQLEKMIQTVD